MNTELFLYLCRKTELYRDDMEDMTIGMCIDYIEEWIENNKTEDKKPKGRKPSQDDFDNF